jgi:hypothetical protein
MTESVSDMPSSVSHPPRSNHRITGCAIYVLAWQLIASLCGLSTLLLFTLSSPENRISTLANTLYIVFPCIFVLGHLAALALGLWFGKRWWPGFYSWLENHPVMISIIPGAISAVFFALVAVWAIAFVIDTHAAPGGTFGPGASMVAMFVLTPAVLFMAPVAGAVGGVLAALTANRVTAKTNHLIFGTIGGIVAGLAFGGISYGLMYFIK